MGDAARAAEMTKEEVALEKRKGLAEKVAARKAASGQAGTVKRAAEEAARKAATGQAGKDKRAGVEATRRAASGQAGKDKHAAGEATRWAKKKAAAATALEEAAAKQRQSRQEQRELYAQLTRKTHETHGKAWCAAEDRKLKDSYFPGVNAHISLCALASFALAPPPA